MNVSHADDHDKKEAVKHIQKAILAYPKIRRMRRNLEKAVIRKLPVDKETAGVVGGVALSVSKGYIDTKVIKKMDIDVVGGGEMRPDVHYNFQNGEAVGTANINWSF